jgi:lipopolysaccharide export system protein LptA
MNKKKLVQILLVFLVILYPVFSYFTYFHADDLDDSALNNKNIISSKDVEDSDLENIKNQNNSSNLIKNLKYVTKDAQNNEYEIISKYGKISNENPDIILMTRVNAKIKMASSSSILVLSDFAEYNSQTFETSFTKNVILNYEDHKINSDNLKLSFEKNLATIYDNIVYTSRNNIILADKLEFDMLTKNSKIFMNEANKKINLTSNQNNGNN